MSATPDRVPALGTGGNETAAAGELVRTGRETAKGAAAEGSGTAPGDSGRATEVSLPIETRV